MDNPYRLLGVSLCAAGAIFAPVSYFVIGSVAMTALGISAVMLGFTCIALASARAPVSSEACELMLQTGMQNTAALLEELELTGKAVYLPSTMADGPGRALVPLSDGQAILRVRGKVPARLIVRYGLGPEEMAVSVTTPGAMTIQLLDTRPGPTPADIEAATGYILTGALDIATSVGVRMTDSTVEVEVDGPRLGYEDAWYYRCLGSPIASIAAAVSSEALGHPVRIKEESQDRGRSRITLEVLE